jgi:hypothetical protein
MDSRARCEPARPAMRLGAATLLLACAGIAGCHLGEVLSPGGSGGDPSPGGPNPLGERTLSIVAGANQRDTVGAVLASPYAVRVIDGNSRPVSGVTVRWSVVAGGGTLSTAQSVTDAGGIARVTHRLGASVGTHTVDASVTGLPGSRRFNSVATHGAPHELLYEVGPANSVMGERISPAIRLVVRDRLGNVTDGTGGSATIALVDGTGTPLAELSGTLAESIVAGRMTFDDVRVSLVGLGYRLRVSYSALASQSAPFDVALIGLQ